MQELIGSTINDILINENKTFILFAGSKGWLLYEAAGECCSESWIEH